MSTEFSRSFEYVPMCEICGHEIEENETFSDHPDYGLCHKDCVDMADNGPSDNDLPDWTEAQ